ncbi:RNA 2',3'-cyclic phosphodiesterase [Planomicrobium sp. YIM 101495]|uniref:RNA 2',3'-cyclic phosphodiesterase n=1 Tax=Planomicrobium sp. YIM 101495 TaxID=2665160 RepID=UPI0018A91252|nr:RNA 2',3'-cyclic phosphodiesterase [Planomicrobium sp. YIM 101495]
MAIHYFIGIPVPLSLAEQLIEQRDGWNLQGFKRYPESVDLHLTLSFIGAAEPDEVEGMTELLGNVTASPFTLKISRTETFGPADKPRVVFAAVEDNQALMQLQRQVLEAIGQLQFKLDPKPFHPHITLANKRAGDESLPAVMPLASVQFEVTKFCLYRIAPQQTPRYIEVAAIALASQVNR